MTTREHRRITNKRVARTHGDTMKYAVFTDEPWSVGRRITLPAIFINTCACCCCLRRSGARDGTMTLNQYQCHSVRQHVCLAYFHSYCQSVVVYSSDRAYLILSSRCGVWCYARQYCILLLNSSLTGTCFRLETPAELAKVFRETVNGESTLTQVAALCVPRHWTTTRYQVGR